MVLYPHRANYSDAALLFIDSDVPVFLALILLYYIVCEQGARFSKSFQDFYENTISTVNG